MHEHPKTRRQPATHPTLVHPPTSLLDLPALARLAAVRHVFVKCEGERPLGNFKILGGTFAAERALWRATSTRAGEHLRAASPRLICASDGNHGLAVASAARCAGVAATVFLPSGVEPVRAERIVAAGARVIWVSGTYDEAVKAASQAAADGHGLLIQDTSDDPECVVVQDVMRGYRRIAIELGEQMRTFSASPTHVFIQAGVGGLAAAVGHGLRTVFREPARLLTVEPESAACVALALRADRPVRVPGALRTVASMLSCGIASAGALRTLQLLDASPVLVSEEALAHAPAILHQTGGPDSTASGAAGVAGLLHVASSPSLRVRHRLDTDSSVLVLATEAAIAPPTSGPEACMRPERPVTPWRGIRFYW